jgi:hypothetical protein
MTELAVGVKECSVVRGPGNRLKSIRVQVTFNAPCAVIVSNIVAERI